MTSQSTHIQTVDYGEFYHRRANDIETPRQRNLFSNGRSTCYEPQIENGPSNHHLNSTIVLEQDFDYIICKCFLELDKEQRGDLHAYPFKDYTVGSRLFIRKFR